MGGTGFDGAYSIKETTDGNYIMAGQSGIADGDITSNFGMADCWVVKLDQADGNILNQHSFGGSDFEIAMDIECTAEGGYIILSDEHSNNGIIIGHHGSTSFTDAWLVKMNAALTIEWNKVYGGSSWEEPYDILITDDGDFVFIADSYSVNGDITDHHGTVSYPDMWLVQTDSLGNMNWNKSMGGSFHEYGRSVFQLPDGGYIGYGNTESNDGTVIENTFGNAFWLVKLGGCKIAEITGADTLQICSGTSATLAATEYAGYDYQWLLDDATIAGADSNEWIADIAGTYSVIITNASGCVDTSSVVILNMTNN